MNLNIVSSFRKIHYFGQSYFCSVCRQRFQSERNFMRHNNSRKHIRQIESIRENACRRIRSRDTGNKLALLPNEVIKELVNDLTIQIDKKDEFFQEIQLVEDCELDDVTSNLEKLDAINDLHGKQAISRYNMANNSILNLGGKLATYPCLTCFQLLDSQQNFNEHMLRSHFNIPPDTMNTF